MVKQKVHDRIKELRSALGLSQTEFAYQTGISHSLLTKIEAGDNPPTNKVIGKITEKWGVDADWLLSGKGELSYSKTGEKTDPWKDEAWTLVNKQLDKKDALLETLALSFDRLTKIMQDSNMSFLRPVAKTGTYE